MHFDDAQTSAPPLGANCLQHGGAISNAGTLTVKYAHFTSNTANISVGMQSSCSNLRVLIATFSFPAHGWNREPEFFDGHLCNGSATARTAGRTILPLT